MSETGKNFLFAGVMLLALVGIIAALFFAERMGYYDPMPIPGEDAPHSRAEAIRELLKRHRRPPAHC